MKMKQKIFIIRDFVYGDGKHSITAAILYREPHKERRLRIGYLKDDEDDGQTIGHCPRGVGLSISELRRLYVWLKEQRVNLGS